MCFVFISVLAIPICGDFSLQFLIDIFHMTHNVEHHFMCLFSIQIYSLVKCLFKILLIFKIQFCVFVCVCVLILNSNSSWYILDTGPFSYMCLQVLSPKLHLSFYSLFNLFQRAQVHNFQSKIIFFSFRDSTFSAVSKQSLPNSWSQNCLMYCLLEIL